MTAGRYAPDRIIEKVIASFTKKYLGISAMERARFLALSQNLPDDRDRIREPEGQLYSIEFDADQLSANESLYALFDFGRI